MIRRIYIDNYKCFSNFEIRLGGLPCSMIIGANGVGKSTIAEVLGIFRALVVDGKSPVESISSHAVSQLKRAAEALSVVTLELELGDEKSVWLFRLTFTAKGSAVSEAKLSILMDGQDILLGDRDGTLGARARALLMKVLVVKFQPALTSGKVGLGSCSLARDASNFANWFHEVIRPNLGAYALFLEHMSGIIPGFSGTDVADDGQGGQMLVVRIEIEGLTMTIPFELLSDGEKCQMLAGALIAFNEMQPEVSVFWDEPDNYITTAEIAYLLPAMCHSFARRGQFIATSHSREAIMTYGENEILRMRRVTPFHNSAVRIDTIASMRSSGAVGGSLDDALLSGEVLEK